MVANKAVNRVYETVLDEACAASGGRSSLSFATADRKKDIVAFVKEPAPDFKNRQEAAPPFAP